MGDWRTDKEPTGKIDKVYGRDTYIAEPEGQVKGIIVIVPDAFGWQLINNQLLADEYARLGSFKVYLPDFMDGTAAALWVNETLDHLYNDNTLIGWLYKP